MQRKNIDGETWINATDLAMELHQMLGDVRPPGERIILENLLAKVEGNGPWIPVAPR